MGNKKRNDENKDNGDKEKKVHKGWTDYIVFEFAGAGKKKCESGYSKIRDTKICQLAGEYLGKKFKTSGQSTGQNAWQCMARDCLQTSECNNIGMSEDFVENDRLVCVKKGGNHDSGGSEDKNGKMAKKNKDEWDKDEKTDGNKKDTGNESKNDKQKHGEDYKDKDNNDKDEDKNKKDKDKENDKDKNKDNDKDKDKDTDDK